MKGDLEIQLLKARLEQTEAALERIVAHMGSVTSRLAMQDMQMGGQVRQALFLGCSIKQNILQKHCCTTSQEEMKSK